jgi:hypothetical protein
MRRRKNRELNNSFASAEELFKLLFPFSSAEAKELFNLPAESSCVSSQPLRIPLYMDSEKEI